MSGVARGQGVSDRRRRVLRAVVDGDDLERVGQGRQRLERLADESLEVRLFVVGREEVGQARDSGRRGRLGIEHPRIVRAASPPRPCAGPPNSKTPAGSLQPGFRALTSGGQDLYEAQSAYAVREGGLPLALVPATIVAITVHVVAELGIGRGHGRIVLDVVSVDVAAARDELAARRAGGGGGDCGADVLVARDRRRWSQLPG